MEFICKCITEKTQYQLNLASVYSKTTLYTLIYRAHCNKENKLIFSLLVRQQMPVTSAGHQ